MVPSKDSIYALQRIDCNCNDCYFMRRDLEKFEQALKQHHEWQLNYFNIIKQKKIEKMNYWKERGETDKADTLRKDVAEMKFQFNRKECSINYGHCEKFDKPVTFIPGTCQIETQKCFIHRKDVK